MTSLFSMFGGSASKAQHSDVFGSILALPKNLMSLPVQPMNILKQAKSYLGMRDEELKIGLFLDPRASDEVIDLVVRLFEPSSSNTRVFVHVINEDMTLSDHVSYHAMVFVMQQADMAASLVAQSANQELPTLVLVEEGLRSEAAAAFGLSILDIASARKPDLLVSQTATWFAENLSEHRMALAKDFAFMRPALAADTIQATARQNAVIAAVFFMPGADMPVMTLNQIKMTLQLAFIYGEEMTFKRVAEAAFVVVSAYAARAGARAISGDMPKGFKWPVKVGVAYASTLALGKGMEFWLLNGPDIPTLDRPLPAIPSLSELAGKTSLGKKLLPAATESSSTSSDDEIFY